MRERQMEDVGSVAAARAETESSGSPSKFFQPRRNHRYCRHGLNSSCSQNSQGWVGYNPGRIQTIHPQAVSSKDAEGAA